jgi:DNA mismatch repair protein MutS
VEYIHNNPRLNCRTLFATHYHELTEMPNILPRTRNFNVAVSEEGDNIIFLHRVVPGGADRSYGVYVAQLAGMPKPVVERARELLHHLETQGSDFKLPNVPPPPPASTTQRKREAAGQLAMFGSGGTHPALEALGKLDVDHLSPLEALTKLYELKRMMTDKQA